MAYEQRDNSGTLWVNDRKQTDRHPDRSGKAMIGGVMYYVDGWIKQGPNGPFLSLSFKPMDQQPGGGGGSGRQSGARGAPARAMPTRGTPLDSDEIPFSPEM